MLKYYDLAEGAYKKALELDASNFDAAYNVGVLYNNRAAYEYEKCSKLKDDAAYAKCKKVADDIYTKAVPFFEKAHALKADDKPTMQQLKKLYAMTGNTAMFDEMKKLLGE
jgi:tetratricopeptide (TPR) repeat protein